MAATGANGDTPRKLPISLPGHLALFPFVEYLRENSRAVFLPCHHKARLLRIAQVLYITKYQHPAFAQIFVKFATRREFGGEFGVL